MNYDRYAKLVRDAARENNQSETLFDRAFTVNGAITHLRRKAYFYVDVSEKNASVLIPAIRDGKYVA